MDEDPSNEAFVLSLLGGYCNTPCFCSVVNSAKDPLNIFPSHPWVP
jgi:hypothetical protein